MTASRLRDLVSYAHKHNEANGEENRDGTDDNLSWNNGVEGESDDAAIHAARARDARNLLATLLFSRGTPMLAMGAEFGQDAVRQQQRLCAGQRAFMDRLGARRRRTDRDDGEAHRAAQATCSLARGSLSRRRAA